MSDGEAAVQPLAPPEQVLARGSELQLHVTAQFSDGTTRVSQSGSAGSRPSSRR